MLAQCKRKVMKLLKYLQKHELSYRSFGKIVPCSAAMICQLISGERCASSRLALRIETATQGQVTRDELLFPELHDRFENIEKEREV